MINIHNNNQTSFLGFANNTVRSPEHCQALAEPSKQASKPISNDRVATFMLYIQSVVTMQTSLVGLVLLAAIKLWLILDWTTWIHLKLWLKNKVLIWSPELRNDNVDVIQVTQISASQFRSFKCKQLCLHKQFQSIFKHANIFLKTQAFTNIPRGLCNPSHTTAGYSLKMRRRHTVFTKCPHLLLMSWELRSERKANWSSQKWKYKAAHMLY